MKRERGRMKGEEAGKNREEQRRIGPGRREKDVREKGTG